MLLNRTQKEELEVFFQSIRLKNSSNDQKHKIEQILAYLEIIHSQVRKLSYKRKLTFIDSGAGNCYLSFLVSYFYSKIDKRDVVIHCIDINERLMENCSKKAKELDFNNMIFHGCSISDFNFNGNPDLVYSLHACDTATDQALYLGLKLNARNILSVSCCQHTIKKELRHHPYSGITKHRIFKDRIVYMIADSMRVLLMESFGYKADIIEFVSSRHTDKNVMIRAKKSNQKQLDLILSEYDKIRKDFNVQPALENYLKELAV
jgi:hypothetical protein